jgi:hypothetical protein
MIRQAHRGSRSWSISVNLPKRVQYHCRFPVLTSTHLLSWVCLRPTVSRPVRLGIRLPFGAHDQILSLSFLYDICLFFLPVGRPLWREDGSVTCGAIADWSGHWGLITIHHRLIWDCVPSYNSQGLRWRYSNPPSHGEKWDLSTVSHIGIQFVPHRNHITSPLQSQPGHWGPITIHHRLIWDCVPSYGSQGLRWRYSNPPAHGVLPHCWHPAKMYPRQHVTSISRQ